MLTTLAEKVDPRNAALIVVDWQNDFWLRQTGTGEPQPIDGLVKANEKLRELLDAARTAGLAVIFVATHHSPEVDSDVWIERRRDQQTFRPQLGSWGGDYYGGISPRDDESVIVKHRWSAFIGTAFDSVLRARGIECLIMTGGSANGCVEKTALDGFQMDYYVVAATECMVTSHPDGRSPQETFSFGVVASNAEIINIWSRAIAPYSSAR